MVAENPTGKPNTLVDKATYIPILESCIIGLVAGVSAVLLGMGVNWLGALRVHLSTMVHMNLVLPAFGLVGGLLAGLLVEKVAPEASGSGIPQVRAMLDRMIMPLDLRIAIVKLVGGTIALGSGFFMGREGPTVQLGAAVAAPISKLFPTTAEHRRQLIAAGAGAGLTAAFNAPLAGVTFVLEELLKEVKPSTIMITLVACSAACFVLNIFEPSAIRETAKQVAASISFVPKDIPFFILLGIAAGVVGALFNQAILGVLNLNRKYLPIPVSLRVALAGLLTGLIITVLPQDFRNYAGMRGEIITGVVPMYLVVVAFVEYYLLTLIAYGSGAPGGLFAPSLALGSSLGYLVGYLERMLTGSASTEMFALVGMGAFFSGVARTPLTAIVITFELTENFALVTPLMFACVISSVVGDLISKGGLYDQLMRWNNIYLHPPDATGENLSNLQAKDLMRRDVTKFSSKDLVKDVLPLLDDTGQQGFPIVDKEKLVGVITSASLYKLDKDASFEQLQISKVMTLNPVALSPYDPLEEVLVLFSRYKFDWLPVAYQDKFEGIVFRDDVVNSFFAAKYADKPSEPEAEPNK